MSDKIKLDILQYSYWEHYKMAKDLSFILGGTHPRVKVMIDEANNILPKIHELTEKLGLSVSHNNND